MKWNQLALLLMIFALVGLYACKSVETTSAMLHNEHGNYEKAIEMAMLAIEKNPLDAEAHFQLGISYSQTGKMQLSFEEYQEAKRLDPNKTEDSENNIKSNWAKQFNQGVAEYQGNNFKGAAAAFEQATFADPRQIKGWLNLAKVYYQIAEEDSTYAEMAYTAVDTLVTKTGSEDDEYADVLSLAGRVMVNRGELEQAVEIFDKLLLDDPANFEEVENVGNDYLRLREWKTAATFLQMATTARLKTDSEDFEVYYNLGVAYYQHGNRLIDEERKAEAAQYFLKAIEAYRNSIRVEPNDKNANYSLLLTHWKAEQWDEAIMVGQDYTSRVAQDDPRGWQILGLCYNKRGMKMKAEEAIAKFHELSQ